MAYIQQQQQSQAQTGNQEDVMSGTYEAIRMSEDKIHIVDIPIEAVRNMDGSANTNTMQQQHHSDRPTVVLRSQQQSSNGSVNDAEAHQSSSGSSSEERQDNNDRSLDASQEGGGSAGVKTPNSYKYPLLKRYYEFGPWIGRNRKAICLGCRLQTSSSQPDRLLKHLNRCSALTDDDKIAVQDLMNERTANKRKRPNSQKKKDGDTDSYYDGEDGGLTDAEMSLSAVAGGANSISIPASGLKKLKRTDMDRNSQIDEALARWIIVQRIPLKAIHSPEFREFVRALNPDYRIPSNETITNVLIPGLLNII